MHFTFQRGCGPHAYAAMWSRRGGRGWGHGGGGGDWGGQFGGGRGEGRGRRRARMFDAGELRLVLLKLIADTPRHGYDLIRDIEERTGGAYAPSPGTIYPTLTLLEEMDLIAAEPSDGQRKLYAITDIGRGHLADREEEVTALLERLEEIGEARQRTDGGSVRRAMSNLGAAIANRAAQGDVDRETMHAIAALIDEAAGKIERL